MSDYKFKLGLAVAREEKLREELASIRADRDAEKEMKAKARDQRDVQTIRACELQQRLTVAEQRAGEMANALARIQGRAEMFIDDGMHMPTPSIEAIRDIAAKAALKPAEECPHNYSNPTGCPVCQGIKP